ncbi:MAG TPA: hypothetical protein VE842_00240 [Pyrinomonadaceae bacterium]|nr:hypothetical protein [Pyrinomonadaceae bacterium]
MKGRSKGTNHANSFFKREAVLTLLSVIVPAIAIILVYLFILLLRWLRS